MTWWMKSSLWTLKITLTYSSGACRRHHDCLFPRKQCTSFLYHQPQCLQDRCLPSSFIISREFTLRSNYSEYSVRILDTGCLCKHHRVFASLNSGETALDIIAVFDRVQVGSLGSFASPDKAAKGIEFFACDNEKLLAKDWRYCAEKFMSSFATRLSPSSRSWR